MIGNLSAKDILLEFYEEDSKLFRLLWTHSCQVAEMALEIASKFPKQADAEFVYDAALLHDIGIIRTNAPSIHCTGTEPYIRHGIIGAEMLRNFDPSLERYALVCERHTGAGISKEEILSESLPLPPRDFLPVSFEEKIICYADKFAVLTNGLGIIRHITFLDDDFKKAHPEMTVDKKSDSPDEDKSIGDSSSLHPVLSDYFSLHPRFSPDTFLGDSAFDTIETYGFLKEEFHFSKALIPYNVRNESSLPEVGYNLYGYPTCPNDPSLAMKHLGHCHEKGRADREKWGCPKVHMVKGQYVCSCDNPCSTAKKGRTAYTYENMDFRRFPGVQRDSEEWDALYKIRTIVERAINHLKTNMCVAGRKSRHHVTTKADVFLAGIAGQLTVIVAHRLSYPQYIRSLKPLIA